MIDELGGLPAHPLLVHLPVVLIPLATLGVVAMLVRSSLVRTFGGVVCGLAGIGFAGAVLASSSGEALEERRISAGETISATLRNHAEMGETAEVLAGVFFALTLAWVLFVWWRRRSGEEAVVAKVKRPGTIAVGLAVLALAAGVAATASITVTGHNGAKAVWEQDSGN